MEEPFTDHLDGKQDCNDQRLGDVVSLASWKRKVGWGGSFGLRGRFTGVRLNVVVLQRGMTDVEAKAPAPEFSADQWKRLCARDIE